MALFKMFKKSIQPFEKTWRRRWTQQGIVLACSEDGNVLIEPLLPGCLAQLQDDGHAVETADGLLIGWDALFEAIREPGYADLPQVLELPPFTNARPILQSSNALTDESFSIAFAGWQTGVGVRHDLHAIGAVLTRDGNTVELMRPEQWNLAKEVIGFARRPADQRDDLSHRQAWGRIRKLALAANARLDDFLNRSVVLTPERLQIGLRKSRVVADDTVIEIEPGFAGAPEDWLERFDSARDVLDRYDIVTPEGIVQVLITPQVKTILKEIKRLPSRRVAGSRAQAFVLNPFATLGEDAKDVIVEEQFDQARDAAGLQYERFVPMIERDGTGYPVRIGLLIETASAAGPTTSAKRWLSDAELDFFVRKLGTSLDRGFQLLGWQGYDFELQGDAVSLHQELKSVLNERRKPPVMVSYARVHDLSLYSSRVESIGIEKPYYSPYIAKRKDDEGWFPQNVTPIIGFTPKGEKEPVAVPASPEMLHQLDEAAWKAREEGRESVSVSWLPEPMPLREADDILKTFEKVLEQVQDRRFDPEKHPAANKEKLGQRKCLILRANIQALDYEERRREALLAVPSTLDMPGNLRPEHKLLPHQCHGVAWLQHLYRLQSEYQVRGAVLADDMGLGKTFQLLTFMVWLVEQDPSIDPMLVVAPVSLLENWKDESAKFLRPGALPILTAYGSSLAPLRVPREAIDARLRSEDGLVKFLRPGWLGSAKVVLTTYETLRDLEFSFAAQRWSVMICDEAQRIKNPAAMVTRAAKKQNVGFKITCTGTPVENTLADLWCLFDYVQPGLLGALDDFGKRYRKPIEAKTDEEKARVEELRARITPQLLRRTKEEVATNFPSEMCLPRKIVVDECKRLPLSTEQRNLYAKAIEDFKKRNDPSYPSPFKNHLGLLHYLRLICTDPRRHGLTVFKGEPLGQYRAKAPKLDWLLRQLASIRECSEKAIIFCEFRNIQRLLQYYIEEVFGLRPDIINGDTVTSADHTASRQKRIKAFQEKPGFGVIILSPVAVGFGVNIQGANHVVHYTRTWNPAKEDQATDRAYRIGQTKDVYVYYPVVCAEDFRTFDVKLDELLTLKRALAGDMLNGAGDVIPGDFDVGDIVPEADMENIDERVTLDSALRMEWRHFEALTVALWSKRGFDICYCTPPTNDNGVDVVAISGRTGELVQTKTSGSDGIKLGWETVKDVVTGEAFYRRQYPGVEFKKLGLTNQFFNFQAVENAELNGVTLLDQVALAALLEKYPVSMLEVERALYTDWSQ